MARGSAITPIVVGLRCRCPRCGRGEIFSGFLTLVDRCRVCGLDLAGGDSGDGPAVFLIFILGFVVVPPALWTGMHYDWPLWLNAVVWSVVILGMTLGMLRPAKGVVLALQYHYRRTEFEQGAEDHGDRAED